MVERMDANGAPFPDAVAAPIVAALLSALRYIHRPAPHTCTCMYACMQVCVYVCMIYFASAPLHPKARAPNTHTHTHTHTDLSIYTVSLYRYIDLSIYRSICPSIHPSPYRSAGPEPRRRRRSVRRSESRIRVTYPSHAFALLIRAVGPSQSSDSSIRVKALDAQPGQGPLYHPAPASPTPPRSGPPPVLRVCESAHLPYPISVRDVRYGTREAIEV